MDSRRNEFVVDRAGQRLDVFLSENMPAHTRSFIKNLIEEGCVLLNGKKVKAGAKPKPGDSITVDIPEVKEAAATPQNIPLDIVYQDEHIAVIDKPQGMVTHPAAGNPDGTLVNAVMYHIKDLSGIGGQLRPGIVHRLNKDTSGLIIIAKSDAAHNALSDMLKKREIEKTYIALVHGNIRQENGTVHTNIDRDKRDRKKMAVAAAGREAITNYRVLERFGQYTLLEVDILTGRTHQIRVHLKHIGHPVVGDALYTKQADPFSLSGQLLHAARLGFAHPVTGSEMTFTAPLPAYFEKVLEKLRASAG
ncbi:MAG: RluA family pseudouridine synthase [Christensenellaceae bacterium]|jgi:23S rRNA pseudouridine1911/1915/1917 synthase